MRPQGRLLPLVALVVAALPAAAWQSSWTRHIVVEWNVPAQMRDGTTLYADVYRPAEAGSYPALLMRTPYDKDGALQSGRLAMTVAAVRRGYIVVVQDTRGQFASEGRFVPYAQEIDDGHDTIEWVAKLPGVNGKVGTFGLSYPGAVQWMTAPTGPPSLAAMSPSMTFSNANHFFYHGGVFEADFVSWLLPRQLRERRQLGLPFRTPEEIREGLRRHAEEWMAFHPLADLPVMRPFNYWSEWTGNPIESDYWHAYDIEAQHHRVQVPALNLSGWNDDPYGQPGAIRNFVGMRANGGTEQARQGQRLVIGPWTHGVPSMSRTAYAGHEYGPNAAIDYTDLQLRFFDYWLKGIDDGVAGEAPVRIFVMGDNRWREERGWPPAGTTLQRWYLADGARLAAEPEPTAGRSSFVYDPRKPVRTPDASESGLRDWRGFAEREGVVAFTGPVTERAVEITGQIVAKLWLTSTAPDTDITGRLLVVAPDGSAISPASTFGVLRTRYRSTETPQPPAPLTPGRPVELTIGLGYTSHLVPAGHRLQLVLTGSMLQGLETHLNIWERFTSISQAVTATHTIHHGTVHASHVIVPTIER